MYLDANFFIFAAHSADRSGAGARKIAAEIIEGKPAMTSVLTIDEVMWVLRRNQLSHEIRALVEEIYAMPNLSVREIPASIPLRALETIEAHHLKPRDAFHIAIMQHFGETEIVTDDKDFDKIPGIRRVRF